MKDWVNDLVESDPARQSRRPTATLETTADTTAAAPASPQSLARLEQTLRRIVRSAAAVRLMLVAVLAEGHVLVEDVPGVGKTTLAQSLARSLACGFKRIQFTSDLLPSDVVGVSVYSQAQERFAFHAGPLFTHVLLADEINRATPRTQSALLEAMNERQVTVDNHTHRLPEPFWVLATQNPAEHHGTYPLPESQLDRFLLRIRMGYPDAADQRAILRGEAGLEMLDQIAPVLGLDEVVAWQHRARGVLVHDAVMEYEMALVEATRHHAGLALGVSPRGLLMLHRAARAWALLEGRDYCVPDDVKRLWVPACAHRVVVAPPYLDPRAPVAERLLEEIAAAVPVPE